MANRKISNLTALQNPAGTDLFVVVDKDASPGADRNKSLTIKTLLKNVPTGSAKEPSLSFAAHLDTGFYNSGDDQIAITCGGNDKAKFTDKGFQIGNGTPSAPFHLFSSDTNAHVYIENDDNGSNAAPNIVLFRNSPASRDNDDLASVLFRGRNGHNAGKEEANYAQIAAKIVDNTRNNEDGALELATISNGRSASRITIRSNRIGINETTPQHCLHVTESQANTGLFIESGESTSSSAADITLYHHRNNAAGRDNDVLSSVVFQGNNDAGTPEQKAFSSISAGIVDATDDTEDGKIDLNVMKAGKLESMVSVTGNNVALGAPLILPPGAPATTTSPGIKGQIAFDENRIYVCIATNQWRAAPLGTFLNK